MAKNPYNQNVNSTRIYRDAEDFWEFNKGLKLAEFEKIAIQVGAVQETGWDYGSELFFDDFLVDVPANPLIKKDFAVAIVDTQHRWGRTVAIPASCLKPGMIIFNRPAWDFIRISSVTPMPAEEEPPEPIMPSIESAGRETWNQYLSDSFRYALATRSRLEARYMHQVAGNLIQSGERITKTYTPLSLLRVHLDEPIFVDSVDIPIGTVKVKDRFWNLEHNVIQEVTSIQNNRTFPVVSLIGVDKKDKSYYSRCLGPEISDKRYYQRYTNQDIFPVEISKEIQGGDFQLNVRITSTERFCEIFSISSIHSSSWGLGHYSVVIYHKLGSDGNWKPNVIYVGIKSERQAPIPCWEIERRFENQPERFGIDSFQELVEMMKRQATGIEELRLLASLLAIAIDVAEYSNQFFELICEMRLTRSRECLQGLGGAFTLVLLILEQIYEDLLSN